MYGTANFTCSLASENPPYFLWDLGVRAAPQTRVGNGQISLKMKSAIVHDLHFHMRKSQPPEKWLTFGDEFGQITTDSGDDKGKTAQKSKGKLGPGQTGVGNGQISLKSKSTVVRDLYFHISKSQRVAKMLD